jgi:hypothetical protein
VLSVAGAIPASASAGVCTGIVTGQSLGPDLVVPAGQRCQLTTSTVTGNVLVQEGGALVAVDSTITGNVVAQGATVQLVRSSVGNNVTSVRPTNYPDPTPTAPDRSLVKIFVCGSSIGGSLTFTDAPGFGSIALGGSRCVNSGGSNTIGGTVLDRNNVATPGHEIVGNRALGLVCSGNNLAPTGSGNTAQFKSGQCASL